MCIKHLDTKSSRFQTWDLAKLSILLRGVLNAVNMFYIPANFFWCKRVRFSSGCCRISTHISENTRKPSKKLRRQSKCFRRSFNHLWNLVPWYNLPSTTSSLSKSENLLWKNCHLCALFNPLLLWVQIKRLHIACLHITCFPGVCQIWLQQLILAWEIGP